MGLKAGNNKPNVGHRQTADRGHRTVRPFNLVLTATIVLAVMLCPAADALGQDMRYRTTISGAEGELLQAISDSATLVALQDDAVPTLAALVRRSEDDIDRVTRALRSFGHYLGTVEIAIADLPPRDPGLAAAISAATGPVKVTIEVEPGPEFTISLIALVNAVDETPVLPEQIEMSGIGIAAGDPARSDAILTAESRLARQMRGYGYPFAKVVDRRAVVDFETRTMDVTYLLEFGPQAQFGAVEIEGLEQVDRGLVTVLATFEEGDRFSPDALTKYRTALTELGVFGSVRVRSAESLDADGRIPVTITVRERKRRFIGFGADFATSEGFGVNGFWGHRNLFGGAERLRLGLEVARIGENDSSDYDYGGTLNFRKPAFLIPEQSLLITAELREENPDAFDRTGFKSTIGVERRLSETLTVDAGISFEYEEITDDIEGSDNFTFVGLPIGFRWDKTDDLLNPTTGSRLSAVFNPLLEVLGSTQNILRFRTNGSTYYDFDTDGETVVAGLVGLGALAGEDVEDVSASKRFYAGGGGTVRGYDFQSVGPLDANDDPIGGRSLFHFSLELRQRVFGDFSLVPFIDGGTVFESEFPDFSDELQYGAGIGIRYATGFGPLRFDVATPLNGRDRDDDVAVYISLGQAF